MGKLKNHNFLADKYEETIVKVKEKFDNQVFYYKNKSRLRSLGDIFKAITSEEPSWKLQMLDGPIKLDQTWDVDKEKKYKWKQKFIHESDKKPYMYLTYLFYLKYGKEYKKEFGWGIRNIRKIITCIAKYTFYYIYNNSADKVTLKPISYSLHYLLPSIYFKKIRTLDTINPLGKPVLDLYYRSLKVFLSNTKYKVTSETSELKKKRLYSSCFNLELMNEPRLTNCYFLGKHLGYE